MEFLLLLLLGGLAAGVGLWATMGDREKDADDANQDDRSGSGPRSSPDLPGAGGGGAESDVSRPVILGGRKPFDDLKKAMEHAPASVPGQVVTGEEADRKKKQPEDRPLRRKPLKVTFNADQIIARSSRYAHHRRALTSADALVEKQKAQEALEIFERTNRRIPDEDITEKIEINIEDIKRWLSGIDQEDDSLQFPEIVIPLTTQAIALENLNESLKTISEGLVQQLSQAMAHLSAPAISYSAPTAPAMPGSVGTPSPADAPSTPSTPSTGTAPIEATGSAAPAGSMAPAAPQGAASGSPAAHAIPSIPHVSIPAMGEIVSVGWADQLARASEQLPPGFEFDEQGRLITDGWTDADFDREWEKYKNLPLKDRRSGKDRRTGIDRRKQDAKRKDRRSGIERRKKDLFKERDEFLKRLEKHKKRKEFLEEWLKKKEQPSQPAFRIPIEAMLQGAQAEPIHEKPEIEPEKPAEAKQPEPEPEPESEPEHEPEPEPEPEPEEEEPGEKPPARMDLVPPDLQPIGLPRADDPYLAEPEAIQATASEAEDGAGGAGEMGLSDGVEEADSIPELGEEPFEEEVSDEPKPPPQEIHGVLELKPPEEDDAPFLTLTYDFTRIPDSFKLSRDYHTMEYAYYKYKPMLVKAQEFTRRKMLKNALNYYRVIKSQNIPPEFKRMVNRNIQDITEYLEKFLMRRG